MLALERGPYHWSRELAHPNMFHYLPTLKDLAPSWTNQQLDFKAPENWTAMNPSVTVHDDHMCAIVRTVNYRMDEHGRYLIQGADGSITGSNPINTRNWLADLSSEFEIMSLWEVTVPTLASMNILLLSGLRICGCSRIKINCGRRRRYGRFEKDGLAEQVLGRLVEYPTAASN